jgi:hypothetical protein
MARDDETGYDDEYDDRHGVPPLDEDDVNDEPDQDDEPWIPCCPACGGDGIVLGDLGEVRWFRCRACGVDFRRGVR